MSETKTVEQIPLTKIDQKENSRGKISETELKELMISMKHNGLLQPIGVYPHEKGRYEVVFGNRRLTAAKKLGWKTVDALIVDLNESEPEIDLVIKNAIENLQRTQPSVFEQGRLFEYLLKEGLTAAEISARTGVSLVKVKATLDVYKSGLPPAFKNKVIAAGTRRRTPAGMVSVSVAKKLSNLAKTHSLTHGQTEELSDYVLTKNVSAQRLNLLAKYMKHSGLNLSEAIKASNDSTIFLLGFSMKNSDVKRYEKAYGMRVDSAIYNYVAEEFDLIGPVRAKGTKRSVSTRYQNYI